LYDGATPSANAVMMENLELMGNLMERTDWLERSEGMLFAQLPTTLRYPTSFARWATYTQRYEAGPKQLMIAGKDAASLLWEWQGTFHPEIYSMAFENEVTEIPAAKGKWMESETNLYLCTHFECGLPVKSVGALKL